MRHGPVVIGALGGSGTRIITELVMAAGWWMGGERDPETQDSLPLRRLLKTEFETLLDYERLSARKQRRATDAFVAAIEEHRAGMPSPDAPWGWKNPRSMWLLPFLTTLYPEVALVHLVRDGRDMAMSSHIFMLKRHGDRLVGRRWRRDIPRAQLQVWAMGNGRVRATAPALLGDRYHRIRYEDLCAAPGQTVGELFSFLGAESTPDPDLLATIRPSPGIGRGRTPEVEALVRDERAAADELRALGYPVEG